MLGALKLASLKSSLRRWLGYRLRLGRPTSAERALAEHLHSLLSQSVDPARLPSPAAPDAAVTLARAVLVEQGVADGSLSGFPWTTLIIVGGAALVIMTISKNIADTATEQARLECIREGKCTDWDGLVKVAAVGALGYFAWLKFGKAVR